MKQILITICFTVFLMTKFSEAVNATTIPNANTSTNSSTNTTHVQPTTLYIGAFFDLSKKDGYGSLPMAQQAIEEINNNTGLLPGYRLELVVKSTQGSFGFGQKVFNEFLTTGPRKIMLLGPVQNALAKSVAAYSGIPDVNLLQFSYGTDVLELASRRDLYPNFFRTKTSLASLDEPRIQFVKEYGWEEVGIIYGDSVQYLQLSNQLADRLRNKNIKVLAEVRLQNNDPKRAIRTLKDKGIHVILGMFSLNSVARKMICEAYREKMYGPHYVWIFLNSFNRDKWWIPGAKESSACSDIEMKCQIQNHFSVYHTNLIRAKQRPFRYNNKTRPQIIQEYQARVDTFNDTSNRSNSYLDVYDAVWSIAFVLNNSRSELQSQGKTLENLTYGDANATDVFRRAAQNLNFASPNVGARVRYYDNGDRRNEIVMKQIVIADGKFKTVSAGGFNIDSSAFTASPDIHWFAGTPYTKTTETYTYRTIDNALFITMILFAGVGILYALFCLLTLVLNLKKKIVKNSGPLINMLIILGCILNYITVILYGFDYSRVSAEKVTSLCRARSWTFAIGFTLSIGGLTAKLWMAYSVLKERFVRSRKVMLFWMFGALVFLLITDIIILAIWETKDPLYRTLKQVRSQPQYECFQPITADTFRAEIEVVEHCDCADLILWLVVILAIKGLILLAGGFLAWQTRRVYIPVLNDTQHCVSCMFVVVLFCVAGVIVAFTTTMYPSVYYGVIGALTIIATTFILVLLFINKIVRLSCRRKRTKTVGIADSSEKTSSCACGATCAKFCSCCACSPACCMAFWSCFPCCNLFTCLRSFFCGSQVHPASSGGRETKTDFYIGGVLQDKDAEIVYLKNELNQKDTMLSNLGQKRTLKSNSTQTFDDGNNFSELEDGDSTIDPSGSDGESLTSSDGQRRFRRAANKVRIFSESVDYSHVKSKVNTGIRRSSLSPSQVRRHSRTSISSLSNEELRKLRATLAEKDDEITKLRKQLESRKPRWSFVNSQKDSASEQKDDEIRRLRKELELRKPRGSVVNSQNDSASDQEALKTSPRSQQILLIETPATPLPDEKTELTTLVLNTPVSPGPSKPNANASDTSSGDGMETASGKPANATQTQDRTKKKNSVGPNGSWLFDDVDHSGTSKEESKPDNKASVGSAGSGRLDDNKEKHGDGSKATSTKGNAEESRRASLTSVTVSIQQGNTSTPKNTGTKEDNESKKDAHGKVSGWLLRNGNNKDNKNSGIQEDENGTKTVGKDSNSGKDVSDNDGEMGLHERNVNHESTKGENTTNEIQGLENDAAKGKLEYETAKKDEERNIEMIDEEDEDNVDDDDDDDDDDDEEDDGQEDEGDGEDDDGKGGNTNGARKNKGRRRKKIGYGKLKWNAASKIDTGSGSYARKKSLKKIPNFKNDYSHVRSRLSSISEGNTTKEKAAENPSPHRRRSVSINKNPLPDYSNVRPRLYNGGRGYNSEMPSTVSKT